jgi:hypothetical protein
MVNGPLWTAEYDPERPQRSEALSSNITAPPVPFALADEVIESSEAARDPGLCLGASAFAQDNSPPREGRTQKITSIV